jgi:branched-subunit amino acid ABC-type transport system permease component
MQYLLPFIIAGVVSGSIYAIASLGLVLSYKTSGVFNFAQGSIAALAAALFYQLHDQWHLNWGIAAVISVAAVGIGVGAIMERLGYVLAHASTAMKVVATVAMMISLTAVFQLWEGFGAQLFPAFLPQQTFTVDGADVGYAQVITFVLGLVALIGLTLVLNHTAFGRNTRAVIDNPELFELTGRVSSRVRRSGWMIGTSFAAVSGILIAPSLGLDATALTLLVIQSFGAAAVGRFASLPWTYVGAMVIGILGSLSTKYAVNHAWLSGVPSDLPFIVLFIVLLATPRKYLIELGAAVDRHAIVVQTTSAVRRFGGLSLPVALLCVVPFVVGSKLPYWTEGLAFMVILIGLSIVLRVAEQVPLCQMSFAAIGAVGMYWAERAGVPWTLALILGGLCAVPIGAVIAIPAIRLVGVYLALATLGFGILLEQQVFSTGLMFGTSDTPLTTPRPSFAQSPVAYYFVVLIVVLIATALVRAIEQTQLGRLLRARAASPVALVSLGVSSRVPAVLAFCVSAFIAGIGGGLIGPIFEEVGPGQFTTVPTSLLLVALLVLAGRDRRMRVFGVSLGAAFALQILPGYLNSATQEAWLNLLFGLAAIVIATESSGIALPLPRRRARSSGPRTPFGVAPDAEHEPVGLGGAA